MALNLALATAALAVVVQTAPPSDWVGHGESFVDLAQTLDVGTIAAPPPAEPPDNALGIPEPGTWSLLAMGIGVVALFAARSRR